MAIRIKNWEKFQHYKQRDPPWIRLYRALLDDREWYNLDGESAKALVMLWLIASEGNGVLPEADDLAFRLRLKKSQLEQILEKLSHWLLQDASDLLARCEQHAMPEERQKERERETERKKESERPRKRGSRLESEWWPSTSEVEYALAKGLDLARVSLEAEKFRNYWTAKAGAGASKLDWTATWQNWILNAKEPRNGQSKPSVVERGRRLAERARELERQYAADFKPTDDPTGSH
jgi:hypothetical protein